MQQQNQDFMDWEGTPDSNVLPSGTYLLHIDELEDVMSKGGKDGIPKRMISGRYSIEEPSQFVGMTYFENLVVGSAEAPTAVVPGSMGTRSFKGLMKACQIPPSNSMQQLLVSANNSKAKFIMQVTYYEEKEGEYAGTPRNRTVGYFKVGERAPGLAEAQPQAPMAPPATAPTAAVPPPVAPGTPTPAPAAPAPAAPTMTGNDQAPAAPAPPQAPQAAAPPQAPAAPGAGAPPAPAAGAPPAPGAAPVAGVGGQMHRCTICNQDVPMTELAQHVANHQTAGDV